MKPKVEVVKGDIFEQKVDAIVNPANSQLAHGGGLAGVISRRAGRRLDEVSRRLAPVPTGSAAITSGYGLPFVVVHTVGPVFGRYAPHQSDALLAAAHRAALRIAAQHGVRSIAFPAVSCGIFGFPVKRAAPIAVRSVKDTLAWGWPPDSLQPALREIERVVFVLPEDPEYRAFRRALYGWWRFWKR